MSNCQQYQLGVSAGAYVQNDDKQCITLIEKKKKKEIKEKKRKEDDVQCASKMLKDLLAVPVIEKILGCFHLLSCI